MSCIRRWLIMNSLPLWGGQEKSQTSCTRITNKTTPRDPLPGGDRLCEGIVLFRKLQKSSKDTEEAKSHLFPGLKFLSWLNKIAAHFVAVTASINRFISAHWGEWMNVKLLLCLLNCGTWHQRDPAGLGCSAPRAWAEGRKTPATHPRHGTPGNHRGRDVWSESWQPHLGNWINIYGHANKSQENLKDVIILPFLQNKVYLYLQWSTSGISLAGGLPSVSYNRDISLKK